MADHYDPQEREAHWQRYWEENKVYAFDPESKKPIFSIDTPPPTMSGRMHIGHAFSYSQQDFIARYKRMRGFELFFPFGTDDNGLPTERMVEKLKGIRAADMERSAFIALCLKTLDELRPEFIGDWKRLGISCDFSVLYSTINEHCRRISQWSFIDLYKKGRAYRKEAPTIWCPECRTAIAQAEMQDKEKQTQLVSIEVKTEGGEPLVFATTRPELYLSCVGMSVHPADARYRPFVGRKVVMPLTGARIELSTDEMVDPAFGTGVVYFCSSGDAQFLEWETRHPVAKKLHLIAPDGTMNENAGSYRGLTVAQARKKIVEDLQKLGVVKKSEQITHTVNAHERCGTVVEYLTSTQWFIRYLDLKEDFLKAAGTLTWYPPFMKLRYDNWVRGLKWDWCISRQRHFGVPFPVWYCRKCGEAKPAEEGQLPVDPLTDKPNGSCGKCRGTAFDPEKDVLDTWATSSLTPLLAARLFEAHPVYRKLLPMSLRPQGHDIISTWLFYTMAKNRLHFGKNPWESAAISGWVLDPYGKKMSKSKGNVIAPQEIMQKYAADALRFAAAGSRLGEDSAFQEKELVTGRKLINKLWNAARFCFQHLEGYDGAKPEKLEPFDRWLLSKLSRLTMLATESFEAYDYSKLRLEADTFFWHTFCDDYLEMVKDRLYNAARSPEGKRSAQYTLEHALLVILKLMAPIMPHITEELYQQHFAQKEKQKSIHGSSWPESDKTLLDEQAERAGAIASTIIAAVRKYKSQRGLSLKQELAEIVLRSTLENFQQIVTKMEADLKAVTQAKALCFGDDVTMTCDSLPIEIGIKG